MAVNFSQLRRRQSFREGAYRSRLQTLIKEEEANEDEAMELRRMRPRLYTESARAALRRQLSEHASPHQLPKDHASPDELGEFMWEMRPRFATSAGELKRRRKHEALEKRKEKKDGVPERGSVAAAAAAAVERKRKRQQLDTIADEQSKQGSVPPSRVSTVSQFGPPEGEDEGAEAWDSKLTFILATIGYAVGLGNVWRFPYLAQKNGGGAFLIPYCIMLFAEGLPLFFLEMAIGQRLRKGAISVWKQVSPYMAGIGIASGVVSFNVALYYNTIIAWCLNYFVRSFQYPLPWSECPVDEVTNETVAECAKSSPTQYFWYRETLDASAHIEDIDNFNWPILACLLAAWILVYLCIIKGITENPKVIYVTAIYPYVVLVIFFFRGITLDGMSNGVVYLFTPKRLADPLVWLEAGTQIFFSLGLAFGGLIAYSSYNPVNNNCGRDALLVAFTNCSTSLFAAIIIFAIMGFKATQNFNSCIEQRQGELDAFFSKVDDANDPANSTVFGVPRLGLSTDSIYQTGFTNCSLTRELDNSASGTGLAFILFTEAVNQFPWGNVWAILFFLMLFTLGLDSQFGTLQGVIQCIIDLKIVPNLRKEFLTGIVCIICFLLSLMFSHGAGNYLFTLFDNFAGSVPLLVIALAECLAVAYIYGLKRFSDDIELMTGNRPGMYWLICWKYISPIAMTVILLASILDIAINGSYYEAWNATDAIKTKEGWPWWSQLLAIILIGASILWIPFVALLRACGFNLLAPEMAAWFPEDELRAYYQLKEHVPTKAERILLGFREDGSEGVCFPSQPKYYALPRAPPNIEVGNGDDEMA